MFNYGSSWYLEEEKYNKVYPKTISSTENGNDEKCYFNGVNIIQKKGKFGKMNSFRIIDIDQDANHEEQKFMSNKTPTRTIPNILKNKSKLHGPSQIIPKETNTIVSNIEDPETFIQVPITSPITFNTSFSENICIMKKDKCDRSNKRKQEHNVTDVCQNVPNWNIYSSVNEKKELLRKNSFMSLELEAPTQKENSKRHVEKQNRINKIFGFKTERKEHLSPLMHKISSDITSEFQTFTSTQETEPPDLQDAVDFSNNEIFNTFNYEYHDVNSLDCFRECMIDYNHTYNSLNTICDDDIFGKELNINGNEVDPSETAYHFLTQDENNREDISTDQCLMNLQCSNQHEALPEDKQPHCSSDVCCDYLLEDCISKWLPSDETKIVETCNENLISINNNTYYQINHCDSDLSSINFKPDSADNTLHTNTKEQCNEKDLYLVPISQDDLEKQTSEYLCATTQEECDKLTELSDIEKQFEVINEITTSKVGGNKNNYRENEKFQCLLCLLTFSSARTMAMHQAGAHGGMYVILCESCGRLFNRKLHYNRHFVHCGRFKEPYKCDMCMRKYRHKSSLVHHLKSTHKVHYARNRSSTFTCSVCKKVYSKFGAFKNHMKRHTSTW